jgi:putative Holliday junction resolvase
VRIGLAVADELGLMAHPRPCLDAKNRGTLFPALKTLVRDEGVTVWVIGLPRNMDGSEGLAARKARKFAADVERITGVSVVLWDERLTTVQAQAKLRESGKDVRASRGLIDSAAAAVLLQSYLEAERR